MEAAEGFKVAFGGLDGGVTKHLLDLANGGAPFESEVGGGAAEIVGGQCRFAVGVDEASGNGVFLDNVVDGLGSEIAIGEAAPFGFDGTGKGSGVAFVEGAEDVVSGEAGSSSPGVDGDFDPGLDADGAVAAAFAHEIDDCPTTVALLDMVKGEFCNFKTAETCANGDGEDGAIA